MGNECTSGSNEDKGMKKIASKTVSGGSYDADEISNPNDSLKQKVGITIECMNLPNLDSSSKTDAFCVLWQVDRGGR